ncbi:putative MnhB-related membrane protein [Sedimentibacter acidaminivorans]|uniref:MnhB-related membrane protein n=1 Tax=Sedimentibacter acidaminivorans TaxID=913099 RepID=A0ABS4GGK0_9FIRM|nr:hypothetical protein [Sedimentibacter acidaminivorans]MBP1926827.1 putative MnhB-related membrane protein [Sedimentibacter acidaminivorans]
MITPEDYYLEYKKISLLINQTWVYAIAILFAIIAVVPMFILIRFIHNSSILTFLLLVYLVSLYKILNALDNPISTQVKKVKINKLKDLTKDNDISTDNFESKRQNFIFTNLKKILNSHNIDYKIYESFYKSHLNNYLSVNKNILGDNIYIPFIFGSIYIGTLQAYYNLVNSTDDLIISFITILLISLSIIIVIHEIKKNTQNKYNDISKLVFYTEMIFQEQEKENKKEVHKA